MDYRYPLSAFQAFAICLSSFDTKPACEWDPCHWVIICWIFSYIYVSFARHSSSTWWDEADYAVISISLSC
jgi:hypothetical protein